MGQRDPHRPVDAAIASGSFTALGIELYELVVFSRHGATAGALMSKEHLMGLQVAPTIAKWPDANDPSDDFAVAVREVIREATDRLVIDVRTPAVDRPAAARALLGLQAGLEALPLKDRRAAAASKLKMPTRTLTKTRYASEQRGKYRPSPELELLADLGQHLLSMEADFLRARSRKLIRTAAELESPDREYSRLYQAWRALDSLNFWLLVSYADHALPSGKLESDTVDSLMMAWVEVLRSFDRPPRRPASNLIEDIDGADARTLVSVMFACSPDDAYRAWFYEIAAAQGTHTLATADIEDSASWLGLTRHWFANCECEFKEERYSDCMVHQFSAAASALKREVQCQWDRVAHATASPGDYDDFVSERPRIVLGLKD
jgi:hypothetical protein